jgi:DNA-binding beta-propeller fold protein YncE
MIERITPPGVPTPRAPYSPAVRAGDFVFVSGQAPIDPATNQVVAEVTVGGLGQDIQITEDAVWTASSKRIMRIDPQTNQIVAEVPFPTKSVYPASITFDGHDVWFEIFEPTSWIARVDPEINQVVALVSYNGVGHGHTHLAYLDGSIWALTDDNAVIRIDPAP